MNLELASFKKSIKREASAYSILKDEHFFDKFQRDLFITAKSHDVSEILDPTFTPSPSPDERELFEAKQVLNPGFNPCSGNPDVTGIPQLNYSTSQ